MGNVRKEENVIHLPVAFLTKYLPNVKGDFFKVYLTYQLLKQSGVEADAEVIADELNITEKAVIKALDFWKEAGEIPVMADKAEEESIPEKEVSEEEKSIVAQMIVFSEICLERELTVAEISSLSEIIHGCHYDFHMMNYLFEYCILKQKKNFRYMEKVAATWKEKGITDAAQAEAYVKGYNRISSLVSEAFGIKGRLLGSSELRYVEAWSLDQYPEDLIRLACQRAILNTGKGSFPYADKVLKDWKSKGVSSIEEISPIPVSQMEESNITDNYSLTSEGEDDIIPSLQRFFIED